MALVIVTQNQYLTASKIHHVTLNEHYEYVEIRTTSGKYKSVRDNSYNINIIYTPENSLNTNSNREDRHECNVTIRGKVNAHKVYQNLINQIREQMPDALFLEKALEKMLADTSFSLISESEEREKLEFMEMASDRKSTKVRSVRKAKRASKKVLRGVKRSSGKRKK